MSGEKNKCQCTVSNFKIVRYDIGITWICTAVCIVLMEKVWKVNYFASFVFLLKTCIHNSQSSAIT